ncbi:MAG TPA: HNH endonuclease, partial [Candidatus Dormibacteraeota bacterium]|nr:HNH endonuclease [Candidatus Dormibacteraeota bacterium]
MPVPAETLRRLACDASVTCVLVSAEGDPLSVGRTRRTFTPAQRKALALRDGGCVLCGRPAAWTACHHLHHWIDGGETSVTNGALLCHRCHVRVHEGGYRLVRRPDRTWTAVRDPRPP